MERNPDLEKFIGENLLSKIGIVIIGIGFLVKLGIVNEVISESMRITIGIVIVGAMVGLAHYLGNSFAYDRKALAVLAIIGGFVTPFLSGNIVTLFSYILILDIGMLALVYFKNWNVINYLTYGFTYLLISGVFISEVIDYKEVSRLPFFLFLTAFYLIFFLMNIVYNVKNLKKFKFPEILMLLSNSSLPNSLFNNH